MARGDDENLVYNDERFHSKNIRQFKRNPHHETTIRARLDEKYVDDRARVVHETTNKVSQTIYCWWHVRRWGWVGLDSGENSGRLSRRKVSTIAIVILLDLYQIIWLDRYLEKKGPTRGREGACLCRDWFGNSVILMYVQICNLRLRDLRMLL